MSEPFSDTEKEEFSEETAIRQMIDEITDCSLSISVWFFSLSAYKSERVAMLCFDIYRTCAVISSGILALYYYWCYQLGIFPKGTDYKPTSPLMKEELRKLDEITAQVRYMSKHNISTLSDLHADREKNQTEMNKLIDYRQHLRNKVRRATPAEKETLRAEKQNVTEQITELRKRLKYADGIEKRSAHIDNCLDQIHDTIENQRSNRQKQPVKTECGREESLR